MKDLLFRYRTEIMGIAAIMIILGHTVYWGIDYGLLTPLLILGYSGVDVFLFLSGFGLFYAMSKTSAVSSFYYRRFIRVIPTFVALMCLASIMHYKTWTLGWFLNPMTWFYSYWYIPFILLMYLIFPFFYRILKVWNKYWIVSIICIFSLLFLTILIKKGITIGESPYMCCAARIPIFFMGTFLASNKFKILENTTFNLILFCFGIISLLPFYFNDNLSGNKGFTTYYCFILIIPGFVYLLGKLCSILPVIFCKILYFSGKISLELYLIHVTIMPWLMNKLSVLGFNTFFCVLIPLAISYIVAFLLSYSVNRTIIFLQKPCCECRSL